MLVTMSDKELSRINVIQSVIEKRMRRRDTAHQLSLTERQTQRLMNRFRESGATGLVNLRRGRPGSHMLPESLKLRGPLSHVNHRRGQPGNRQLIPGLTERALRIIRELYADFGPILACEKLAEIYGLYLAKETIRKLMTRDPTQVTAAASTSATPASGLYRRAHPD